MSAREVFADPTQEALSRVREAQVELLYQFPERVLGHVINGLLVVAILWGEVPTYLLLGWLSLVLAAVAVRLLIAVAFKNRSPGGDIEIWVRRFAVGSTVSAAFWGVSAAAIVWLTPSITYHVLIAFIIAGTCSAATTMTFAVLPTLYGFLLAAAGPLAISFVLVGEGIYLAMGLMTALLVILMAGRPARPMPSLYAH